MSSWGKQSSMLPMAETTFGWQPLVAILNNTTVEMDLGRSVCYARKTHHLAGVVEYVAPEGKAFLAILFLFLAMIYLRGWIFFINPSLTPHRIQLGRYSTLPQNYSGVSIF